MKILKKKKRHQNTRQNGGKNVIKKLKLKLNLISFTLKKKNETGIINSKHNFNSWKQNNPNDFALMIAKSKQTINSEEYKNTKWKLCNYCNYKFPPGVYAKDHGEKCIRNHLRIINKQTCKCCNKQFRYVAQHLNHNKNCKRFYDDI